MPTASQTARVVELVAVGQRKLARQREGDDRGSDVGVLAGELGGALGRAMVALRHHRQANGGSLGVNREIDQSAQGGLVRRRAASSGGGHPIHLLPDLVPAHSGGDRLQLLALGQGLRNRFLRERRLAYLPVHTTRSPIVGMATHNVPPRPWIHAEVSRAGIADRAIVRAKKILPIIVVG